MSTRQCPHCLQGFHDEWENISIGGTLKGIGTFLELGVQNVKNLL